MTICIAAICEHPAAKPMIVLCSDTRGSSALGNKEWIMKERPLRGNDWTCLTAGIEHEMTATLPILKRHIQSPDAINETNVRSLVCAALTERKLEKADTFIRGKWGLSYEQFRKDRGSFPEDAFRDDMDSVSRITIDADFIVSGFLDDGMPILLETGADGDVKIREDYAIIGEGTWLAQAALTHREQVATNSLARTLYCVYEAKKHAQRIGSVGDLTLLSVHAAGVTPRLVKGKAKEYLDQQIQTYGPKDLQVQEGFDFFAT